MRVKTRYPLIHGFLGLPSANGCAKLRMPLMADSLRRDKPYTTSVLCFAKLTLLAKGGRFGEIWQLDFKLNCWLGLNLSYG